MNAFEWNIIIIGWLFVFSINMAVTIIKSTLEETETKPPPDGMYQ